MSRGKFWKLAKRLWLLLRVLSEREKLIAIYCMTEQTNRVGFFPFSSAKATDDLGLSRRAFETAFQTVCDALGWQFDSEARVLFLTDWWRYNDPGNRDAMRAFLQDLLDVPPTPLIRQFLSQTADLSDDLRQVFEETVKTLSLPGCPSRCPLGGDQGAPQGGGEGGAQGPPHTRLDETRLRKDMDKTPVAVAHWVKNFTTFWDSYPRKVGHGDVEAWFRQRQPDDALLAVMLAKLVELKASKAWQEDGGKYIPAPAKWLRRKGWLDAADVQGLPTKKRIVYT